jgi:large subunit ribosomal protein L9
VTKSQIVLDRPIKNIGMHDVKVALHPEVAVTVHVNVARSPEEAELQAQGIDVIQAMFEEQAAPIAAEALAPEPEGEEAEAGAEAPAEEASAEEAPTEEAPVEAEEAPAAEAEDEAEGE